MLFVVFVAVAFAVAAFVACAAKLANAAVALPFTQLAGLTGGKTGGAAWQGNSWVARKAAIHPSIARPTRYACTGVYLCECVYVWILLFCFPFFLPSLLVILTPSFALNIQLQSGGSDSVCFRNFFVSPLVYVSICVQHFG